MNRRILLVAVTLVLSFSLRIWLTTVSSVVSRESLTGFPKQIGSWTMSKEDVLDDETSRVLQADDYVLRSYQNTQGQRVDLFIAYYKTQKAGESMHSPKNCLPGSGWGILNADNVALWPGDSNHSTMINRYLVEKNGARALVLYWYQANGRVIASEYWGKIYLVVDSLRTGRRDGAIVRFVVPIAEGSKGNAELEPGLEIARSAAPLLPKYLPN